MSYYMYIYIHVQGPAYDRIRGTCSFHDDDEDEIENRRVFTRFAVRIRSRKCLFSPIGKFQERKDWEWIHET